MSRLDPKFLISAYAQGVFPMAHPDGEIYIYDPDPRAIIPLDDRFHVPRSLRRAMRKNPYEIRVDSDFRGVMLACAATAPDRPTTWINDDILESYVKLHEMGLAHSVECWQDEKLVGGLYGVAIRGLFAGESMFSRATDASKIALVHLVERLRKGGFTLLDTQFKTEHLARFGAYEISRAEYQQRLAEALKIEGMFFPEV